MSCTCVHVWRWARFSEVNAATPLHCAVASHVSRTWQPSRSSRHSTPPSGNASHCHCAPSGVRNVVKKPPNYTEVFWSLAFVTVNGLMIVQILRDRAEVEFNREELDLYEKQFMGYSLTPRGYQRLLAAGEWVDLPDNHVLCREGDNFESVYMVSQGVVEVERGKKRVHRVEGDVQGALIGAISFLEDSKAREAYAKTSCPQPPTPAGFPSPSPPPTPIYQRSRSASRSRLPHAQPKDRCEPSAGRAPSSAT